MNNTTLAATMEASATSFKPTATTGAAVGSFAKVDLEYMIVIGVDSAGFVQVRTRGNHGGSAVKHYTGASVTFGLESEMSNFGPAEGVPTPSDDCDMLMFDADGAIPVPTRKLIVGLRKGSAAAMTLAAPSKERNGTEISIHGLTDFAHVVTTSGYDGTTGVSTTFTSAAFRGSCVTLVAIDGSWYVKANALFVIT